MLNPRAVIAIACAICSLDAAAAPGESELLPNLQATRSRRFELWRASRCPSGEQQLQRSHLDQPDAMSCSLLCVRTPGCYAICIARLSESESECRLFHWDKFTNDATFPTVDCSAYGGGCYVASQGTYLIALRNCSQSSVAYEGYCEYAIDANLTQAYYSHPCSHTNLEVNRWWTVSFASKAFVASVTIYNRLDFQPERLDNFDIAVDNQVCSSFALNRSAPFSVRNFPCNRTGVSLQISSRPLGVLTLCEVQVWGYDGRD